MTGKSARAVAAIVGLLGLSATCYAELATVRTATGSVPRGDVICDMTTGVATGVGAGTCVAQPATCNGDMVTVNRTARITSGVGGNKYLNVTVDTFTNGDVGKVIYIFGSGLPNHRSTIAAWTDAQNVVLANTVRTPYKPTAVDITYGTDDSPAFAQFNQWANLTWQARYSGLVEQYIPSGKGCQILTGAPITPSTMDPGCISPATHPFPCQWGGNRWSKGIRKLLMNFSGSSVAAGPGVLFFLGATDGVCRHGLADINGCSARTATAFIGATSVTLLDTSLCSRFTPGRYAVMTGYDVQGVYKVSSGYGYPINPGFYDYAKITSTASCAATGVVNLDRPLTNNYKSTWPQNCPGGAGEADCGGPATLYSLPAWWDIEAEYRGGTFYSQTQLTNGQGRKVTYRNISWSGVNQLCAYPTQNIDWNVIGGDWLTAGCNIEMDKVVVNATIQNASVYKIHFQSMSPRYTNITNSTINILSGGSRNTTITDSTITTKGDLFLGVSAFGRADSWNCTNCIINSGLNYSGSNEGGSVSEGVWALPGQAGGTYNSTMIGGVIKIPNTHGAVTWAVPGTNIFWSYGGAGAVYMYQVLDITQDATNQYVTTNCVGENTVCGAGGRFPISSGYLTIATHPAPKFNCKNCSGTPYWAAVNNGPTDAPVFSYQSYSADVTFPISTTPFVRTWGKVKSLTVTVNKPYAGAGSLNFRPVQQFVFTVYGPRGTTSSYVPLIDLKTGGTRTITSIGCTGCAGADSGTTLPFGASTWFSGPVQPNISAHPAWAGTINVTMQFDQGVVNP